QVGLESIEITYEVEDCDTREDVTLSFPAEEYTAYLGEAFAAPELTGVPEGAEIVYTSSNEAVATVAANGAVTLVAEGTTTITAAFDGNDNYKAAEPVSYTLKVVDPNGPVYLYKLVTDINDLNEGDIVTIACNTKEAVMTNADQANFREEKTATFYSNHMYLDNEDEIMQLVLGKSGNNWTFKALNYEGTNGYIGNNSNKNNCTINTTVATGFAAAVTISADGDASIVFNNSNSNIYLTYNASSPRFACYANMNQTAVQIYKRVAISMPLAAPTAEIAVNDVIIFSQDGFDVEFAISQSDTDVPETFELHEEAIVLKNLNPGMNYIWAKTVVGPYESEAECIHVYENIDTEEAKEVACTYTHNGTMPQNNCWVVIGAEVNGKHYFMGPDGKATLATVSDNAFAGYASHFNNTINEYRHIDGNLTIKPAAAHVMARAASNEGMTLSVADNGTATVTNAEGTLGFDAENKVFSTDAANKNLKVFATQGDVNTGVDNVAADNENAPAEYYNLQGVRIENPAKGGLYIKRQGTKVTKVAL
ncbi:MAG: Ig-like domain-containing protein, partial [Muribaculaceae bacterium]|nr:Ig-like domain-containing protein [Muribaculaceae bacterium]